MRLLTALVATLLVLAPVLSYGQPAPTFAHLQSTRHACLSVDPVPVGCVSLPRGYYMDESTFDKLDAEVRRLQDSELRLKTENTSLRASSASWQPGWVTMLTMVVSSVALTLYVEHKL